MVNFGDRPPVRTTTIQTLRDAFETADQSIWAVVPEVSGKHGHPYLVGRGMIEAVRRTPATRIARDIAHQHQTHIRYVPLDAPLVPLHINTPDGHPALFPR